MVSSTFFLNGMLGVPRAGLDAFEKGIVVTPCPSISRSCILWRSHCNNWAILRHIHLSHRLLLQFLTHKMLTCQLFQCSIVRSSNLRGDRFLKLYVVCVLYGCETWSLTLREERRLRVFENRVLRRVFGHKRDEVTGEWRKLHNEELNDLYPYPILCGW